MGKGAREQGSKGAREQGSNGAMEQWSNGAMEEIKIPVVTSGYNDIDSRLSASSLITID